MIHPDKLPRYGQATKAFQARVPLAHLPYISPVSHQYFPYISIHLPYISIYLQALVRAFELLTSPEPPPEASASARLALALALTLTLTLTLRSWSGP